MRVYYDRDADINLIKDKIKFENINENYIKVKK